MSIDISEIDSVHLAEPGVITILPEGSDGIRGGAYSSTSLSLAKVLTRENLPFKYLTKPERLFEQRGAEWFGPALLIASNIFEVYPDVVKLLLDSIKVHVAQLYPSVENPKIKMSFIISKTKSKTNAEIVFEGGADSFSELLSTIEKVCAEKSGE
ncbi:hypothetical protein ACXUPC_00220 [Pseudomonas marginalis]|uniref:hypothetical protein n=1 Tax=Pseudomonas marginalis TaxID=298 RepID=UPI0038B50035